MTEYLVVGKNACSRCDMVKNILNNKGVKYEYIKLEDMTQDEKTKYLKMARDAKQLEMPLIIKDNTIISIQEVK